MKLWALGNTRIELLSKPQYNSADVRKQLNSTAKVINDFEYANFWEKNQDFIAKQRINLADVAYIDLDLIAKVLTKGEYTKFSDEKLSNQREIMPYPYGTV